MSVNHLTAHSELYFRTHLHSVVPLHAALIEEMCKEAAVPLELATVLEDIGQAYICLADEVNAELKKRDQLKLEPPWRESIDAQLDRFVRELAAGLKKITLDGGQVIDGRKALEAFPMAMNAIKTAVVLEKSAR